ncbi:hypothetical protein [Roseibium sp.]|uniref:hypothetical protein n=1 Tax=Roseibium sp. TaxID=1936156 RepID=UPI003BAF9D57
MLDDLGDHGVHVDDISASIRVNSGDVLEDQYWELIDDLCEGILKERWGALTDQDKLGQVFEVIQLWPCYPTASLLPRLYMSDLSATAEVYLWQQMLQALEHHDRPYREAIEYVLWVDFFENQAISAKAWNGLMGATPGKQAKARLLVNSGPVPYAEKRHHYHELLENQEDHELLAECLARCLNDVYGKIDRDDAHSILRKLRVGFGNKFMSYLKHNL